ncbi:MAG: hypothetical protein ACHQD8_04540 [Chitinophagales bacterium]
MSKHSILKGALKLNTGDRFKFNLPLIIFEEGDAVVCYCPALDLSGYGNTEGEAVDSYKYVMGEYFDYTVKKKTLVADLKKHGWAISKSAHKKMTPPTMTKILETNEDFQRVFNNYSYKKIDTNISIPA